MILALTWLIKKTFFKRSHGHHQPMPCGATPLSWLKTLHDVPLRETNPSNPFVKA